MQEMDTPIIKIHFMLVLGLKNAKEINNFLLIFWKKKHVGNEMFSNNFYTFL